jgi:2-oxo-4-hydroxy-4-carboxy-5-ureidoimidazoline decarboxylase
MSGRLSGLPEARLSAALEQCGLPSAAIADVMARAPFADDDALGVAVNAAVLEMPQSDLEAALAAEPEPGTEEGDADALDAARLALRLYESRFGYSYVSSIPTPTAEELLMRVRIRLGNEPEPEGKAAREHFRRLVQARLQQLGTADATS